MSDILRCLQMLPNIQISCSESFQEILPCFMQHINGSCYFKWKYAAQVHCYSIGIECLGINTVHIACFCEVWHTNNLPPPKFSLKICLSKEITPHFQCLCSVRITAFQSIEFSYQADFCHYNGWLWVYLNKKVDVINQRQKISKKIPQAK